MKKSSLYIHVYFVKISHNLSIAAAHIGFILNYYVRYIPSHLLCTNNKCQVMPCLFLFKV